MITRILLLLSLGLALAWLGARLLGGAGGTAEGERTAALVRFGPYQSGMSLRQAFESLPARAGRTELTLLQDNTEAWVARWRMLEDTRETLDVSYFILREDLFGAAFLGALLELAHRGVRVRLLFDAQGTVMSFTSPRGNDWLDTLANHENIEIKIFRPLLNRYAEALLTINPVALVASEHDKIMVADRRVGMIGGRNISAEYFADPRDMDKAFEDLDVILQGEATSEFLIAAFETQYRREAAVPIRPERLDITSYAEELHLAYLAMDAWLKDYRLAPAAAGRIAELGLTWLEDLARYPRLRGAYDAPRPAADADAETRLLDSRTRLERDDDAIGEAITRLLRSAREEVLIVSPYLVLSENAVAVLAEAGARGVAITVLTNSPLSSDNAMSQAFFLEQWPELLARVPGLRIFVVDRPGTLHSKVAVFDGRVTLVGTYNLDPISMQVNSEIMAAVWSAEFARQAAALPRAQLAAGPPLTYEYRIERDAQGRPVRGDDGAPVVAFGPADHSAPEQWPKIQVYWNMLRTAEKLTGFSPIF